MREIVLDTETTGLDPEAGHRLVEIGCVELENHLPTGRIFHVYINPERLVDPEAFQVHGLSDTFLAEQPVFGALADDFLHFIADAKLVIHNAAFDLGFINSELQRLAKPLVAMSDSIDTLQLARAQNPPGARNSLDALCQRFGIDNSGRVKHGALLDAELLAEVYLELLGGRQPDLTLSVADKKEHTATVRKNRPPRPHQPTPQEAAAHDDFMASIPNAIWKR